MATYPDSLRYFPAAPTSISALTRTPLPDTVIVRLQSAYPFFFTTIVCCPGTTDSPPRRTQETSPHATALAHSP